MKKTLSILGLFLFTFCAMGAGLTVSSLNGVATNLTQYGTATNLAVAQPSAGTTNVIAIDSTGHEVGIPSSSFGGSTTNIIDPSNITINTLFTNTSGSNLVVIAALSVTTASSGAEIVGLKIDQNNDGTFETFIPYASGVASQSSSNFLVGAVSPNGVYEITASGSGSASIISGSCQRIYSSAGSGGGSGGSGTTPAQVTNIVNQVNAASGVVTNGSTGFTANGNLIITNASSTNILSPNGMNVNGNFALVVSTLPEVWVGSNNMVQLSNGSLTNFSSSTTAGIQEAIDSLPKSTDYTHAGGGTIHFSPQIFLTSSTIKTPLSTNGFSLTFAGSGISSCGILNTNNVPTTCLLVQGTNSTATTFLAYNMFFSSVTNAATNLVYLSGAYSSGSTLGGIARAKFDYCLFGWWGGLTNWAATHGGFTPDVGGDSGVIHNLVVRVDNNFGDDITFTHCSFDYLQSLTMANDHACILYNSFEGCGNSSATAWPSSSPNYAGYAVVFRDPLTGSLPNGTEAWKIFGNVFVGNGSCYLFDTTFSHIHYIYEDNNENSTPNCATSGSKIVFVNPVNDASISAFDITNTSDFSKPFQVDTGLVQTVSLDRFSSLTPVTWWPTTNITLSLSTNSIPINVVTNGMGNNFYLTLPTGNASGFASITLSNANGSGYSLCGDLTNNFANVTFLGGSNASFFLTNGGSIAIQRTWPMKYQITIANPQ